MTGYLCNESQNALDYYHDIIAPALPSVVLDFHAHAWTGDQWNDEASDTIGDSGSRGAAYMALPPTYNVADLFQDGKFLFPDRPYHAVVFGQPTPYVDVHRSNAHIIENIGNHGLYPLLIVGRGWTSYEDLRRNISEHGFLGYKVFLNWKGNDYGNLTIDDMIGPNEMRLADEMGLVVLLHVPRANRLADPCIQTNVRELSKSYPNAQIVLAHCGRCYKFHEINSAIQSIRDLENVFLDTAMVMDPTVIYMAFDQIGPGRVLFGTDLPLAAMRGRRVRVMDHWVDVVSPGYASSDFRVASEKIRATYMVYEIIHAIVEAGQMLGLSDDEVKAVFYDNGMQRLKHVIGGKAVTQIHEQWA